MAALSDRLPFPDDAIPEGPVAGPLLLAAPLILFAREQGHVLHAPLGRGDHPLCTPEGVARRASRCRYRGTGHAGALPGGPDAPRGPTGAAASVAAADWDVLERFAAKTLVPETAASRALGAGSRRCLPRLKEPEPVQVSVAEIFARSRAALLAHGAGRGRRRPWPAPSRGQRKPAT
jgi:hypothetical protein